MLLYLIPQSLSFLYQVYNILGHYMVSMVLSLVVSLTFEAPFLALEKILFGMGGGDKRDGDAPLSKKGASSEPPSYDSELRHQRTFTKTNSNGGHSNGGHSNGGHSNGSYRNGGDGLYRPTRESGVGGQRENGYGQVQRGGQENGAFCRL